MNAPSPSAVSSPAATAPRSVTPPAERGEYSATFRSPLTFGAMGDAEAFLRDRGFAVGACEGTNPRAVMLDYGFVGKWSKLSPSDREDLHGLMSGDMRHGPVTVDINSEAPAAVIEAFRRDEEPVSGALGG